MKRKVTMIAMLVLILSLLSYGTYAFFTTEQSTKNVISTGVLTITLHDLTPTETGWAPFVGVDSIMPGMEVKETVKVENTGDFDAWIRVSIDVDLPESIVEAFPGLTIDDVLSINFDTTNWTYQGGWYYYHDALASATDTAPLFTSITLLASLDNRFQGQELNFSIKAEAVQSDFNGSTVFDAIGWPLT